MLKKDEEGRVVATTGDIENPFKLKLRIYMTIRSSRLCVETLLMGYNTLLLQNFFS